MSKTDYYDYEDVEVVTRYRVRYKHGSAIARADAIDAALRSGATGASGVGKGGCYGVEVCGDPVRLSVRGGKE